MNEDQQTRVNLLRQQILQIQNSIQSHQSTLLSLQLIHKSMHSLSLLASQTLSPKPMNFALYNSQIDSAKKAIQCLPTTTSFNHKQHIDQSLKTGEIRVTKNRVDYLRAKVQGLYGKVQQHLEREEPYIHEKIFARLKSEVESYGRARLVQRIKGQVEIAGKWRERTVDKSAKESGLDAVRQEIAQNIALLKQIKERKVLENDILWTETGSLKKAQERMKGIPELLGNVSARLKVMMRSEEVTDDFEYQDNTKSNQQSISVIEQLNQQIQYFNEAQIWQLTPNTKTIDQPYSKLAQRLNNIKANLQSSE